MPKYLWCASYSTDGLKGVMKEGGTARREAVEKMAADMGFTIESFYFSFGDEDAYLIVDMPDNVSAAAASIAVAATGAVRVKTIPLLTPDEIDRAVHTKVTYRPPGT